MKDFSTHAEDIAGGGQKWETVDTHKAEPEASDHQSAAYSMARTARQAAEDGLGEVAPLE